MRVLMLAASLAFLLTPAPPLRAENSLERIKREGVLRWGADPSGGEPFVYTDPQNPDRSIGFEVDLMEKLAERLGVKAELVPGQWEALPESLKARRIDLVLNGLEVTPERAKVMRFTVPYFVYVQQITVRKEDSDRRSLSDLKGRKVAVLGGSAAEKVLRDAGWTDDLIEAYDDSLKPYEALRDRRVDAVLAESIIAACYAPRIKGLINQPDTFAPGKYAGAVRLGPDDTDLVAAINQALAQMKADGELLRIYQRWKIYSPLQRQVGIISTSDKKDPPQVDNKDSPQVDKKELPQADNEDQQSTESDASTPTSIPWGPVALVFLRGARNTLLLTAISMPLALFFGLVLALMGMSRLFWLRWPARAYIQVIRGTPLLVQILLVFYGLPQLGEALHVSWLTWDKWAVGILCLTANYAAYEAEIHRAGLEALPKGQFEAARSLGMSDFSMFRYIVFPQSFRIILPPVVNDLVTMLKDSCLVSAIGLGELLQVALNYGKSTARTGQFLLIAAIIYLIMSLVADKLGTLLANRLRLRGAPRLALTAPHH